MTKKLFCILLCAAMAFGTLGPAALAAESGSERPEAVITSATPELEATPAPAPLVTEAPENSPAPEAPEETKPAGEIAAETPLESAPAESTPAESVPAESVPPEAAPSAAPAEPSPAAEPAEPEPVEPEEQDELSAPEAPEDESPLSAHAGGSEISLFSLRAASKTFSDFTPRAQNNETLRIGVDVSSWQHTIDWKAVAASGVEFAIIRAAYRTVSSGTLNEDSYFRANVTGAKAAGLKVGVYIFSQAITTEEAVEEAEFLMNTARGYSLDLPYVLDFEHYPEGRLENARLTKRQATDICNAFCARIERSGYTSMVYANPSMLHNNLYPGELGRLWLAHYTAQTSYSASPYEFWQCTSSGGVDGIEGNVDLNFWFEPNMPFRDVKAGVWYYDNVAQAYGSGIVAGMRADLFDPDGTATRGQFVAMLHRMMGAPTGSPAAGFTDLVQNYYKEAVYWAAANGITSGYSETVFGPERNITREELVSLLYRVAGSPETGADLSAFTDAGSVQAYAQKAMAWAVENKIVAGYENATLRPRNKATRAEVCAFLMRYAALNN